MSFLALISERLPRLKRLHLHDSEKMSERVPSLKQIGKVVFEEPKTLKSSSSTPMSVSAALSKAEGKRRADGIKTEPVPVKVEMMYLD